jgi:hypothetical protein
MENLPSNVRRAYLSLADLPEYRHFVRIPDRIIQCIDYFGISCDWTIAKARLHAYYLFIGVVDEAIDSGRIDAGRVILDDLSTPAPAFDEEVMSSRVRLITEILKCHIDDNIYPSWMAQLQALYSQVVSERSAASIESYIEHRESVGSLTAELSFALIQPNIRGGHQRLLQFMKEVGAIGCMVDSLIDLSNDRRLGLLAFKPRAMDYMKLAVCTLSAGLRVSLRHPGLGGLFLCAIADNIRDRFRGRRDHPQHSLASERKDEAASVA